MCDVSKSWDNEGNNNFLLCRLEKDDRDNTLTNNSFSYNSNDVN